MLGAINALSIVLAVRLILLLAVCGAFVLALLTVNHPPSEWGVLVVYTVAVVIPLVALAAFR
jgi:hypothetical protein